MPLDSESTSDVEHADNPRASPLEALDDASNEWVSSSESPRSFIRRFQKQLPHEGENKHFLMMPNETHVHRFAMRYLRRAGACVVCFVLCFIEWVCQRLQ